MRKLLVALLASVLLVLLWVLSGAVTSPTPAAPAAARTVTVEKRAAQTLYITNLAPRYISDAEIRNSIPAWEQAINVDFARYWHTTQFRLVFLGRKPAPFGHMSAVFLNKGPVKGALAYHWTERGNAPSITVYAGTGAYYGFSNSVSFMHELEELAADPVTSYLNIGYPLGFYYLEQKNTSIKVAYNDAVGWFSEVSDPVEADWYCRKGANGKCVKISDFVTPAWFGDGVGSRFDFMGLCQQPLWIRPGGYAQYLNGLGWQIVFNFRHGHPSDAGFSKMDPDAGASRGRD